MLTLSDIALIERDAALPGLRTVLDPEALVRALGPRWPGLRSSVASYVRYKPGTNALVAHRLDVDGAAVDVYAKVYRPEDREKLDKARQRDGRDGPAAGRLVLDEQAVVVFVFPYDARLRVLARMDDARKRRRLLRRVFHEETVLCEGRLRRLRYKPERRYVGRLDLDGVPRAVLKVHRVGSYRTFRNTPKAFKPNGTVRLPRRVGHSDRHGIMAFEWMHGRPLDDAWLREGDLAADARRVGTALAELHAQEGRLLRRMDRAAEAARIHAAAAAVRATLPEHASFAGALADELAGRLARLPDVHVPVHGDFYARQVLLAAETVSVLDFDESAGGDAALDPGNFLAHAENDRLRLGLPEARVEELRAALLDGYASSGNLPPGRVTLYAAAGLFLLAPHPFRLREPGWPERTNAVLERVERLLRRVEPASTRVAAGPVSRATENGLQSTEVDDPFGAAEDAKMPSVARALDPAVAGSWLEPFVSARAGREATSRLRRIRVLRHKPGRRCLIGYDVEVRLPGCVPVQVGLVGKVRAKGLDEAAYRVNEALWASGFGPDDSVGIRVPEPVGCVPELRMWLQRRVPGVTATEALAEAGAPALARRLADVLHRLRRHGPEPVRVHTMDDELRILHERLPRVALLRPSWTERLDAVLAACDRLGSALPAPEPAPVHRDFHPGNVLVDGDRITLLDLDLYALGDPAVDAGNFIAHLTEQSLRATGDPEAWADRERAFAAAFAAGVDARTRRAVRVYTTLTLVRHIELSTRFRERRPFTGRLLALCEERLRAHGSVRGAASSSLHPAMPNR